MSSIRSASDLLALSGSMSGGMGVNGAVDEGTHGPGDPAWHRCRPLPKPLPYLRASARVMASIAEPPAPNRTIVSK